MKSTTFRRHSLPLLAGTTVLLLSGWLASGSRAASDDVLERSRAFYASLRSYADTGVVITEVKSAGTPAIIERHTFTTYYRAPRHFYFEFKDKSSGGDRFAIWGDDEAFHSWWSTTGVENTYPRGTGASAFVQADYPTKGSALQISPLLFTQAGLRGALTNVKDASTAGTEDVDGRRCHKLLGVTRDVYGATGKEVRVRRATIWIDAETLLVRKVLEDTPRGMAAGTVMRVTTTFDPKANPKIEDSRFRFAVPSSQK